MNNRKNIRQFVSVRVLFTWTALLGFLLTHSQRYSISQILDTIQVSNAIVRMYDADIRSMDEAANGARSWMPPEVGAGLFMTPYNTGLWKKTGMEPGMGSVMFSIQQMFPNRRKLNADAAYMQSMSGSLKEQKKAALNEIYAQAKRAYYNWVIVEKKRAVLNENEKILDFMIRNAEIRYKNGLEKISAYYKAKAALGSVESMKVMLENENVQNSILLNTLMYRDKNKTLDLNTIITIKDYSSYHLDSTLFASARSDINAINREMQVNQLRQESERLNLKPQFGIKFEHMAGFGAQPQQFTAMAMLRLPFVAWASRMTKANIESYKWRNEALNNQKQMLINEAIGMSVGMRTEIEAKKKQIRLYENNIIPALRNNYKTTLLAYEQNTEELFMLYDAWETLNMTQNEYLDQLRQLLLMQVEMERILQIRN